MSAEQPSKSSSGERAHAPSDGTAVDRPGSLSGEAWLSLQTHQAQRLINGRRHDGSKPSIIGLTGFAAMVRTIWAGAQAGDPYADWWLIKVDSALEQSRRDVQGVRAIADECLSAVPAVEIRVAQSLDPVRMPLNFGHPYAFRAAYLLAELDEAVRVLLTARHVGLLCAADYERRLHEATRAVRRVFSSPVGYKHLGITREDVTQGTVRATEAREWMGQLPPEVLTGQSQAPYAPRRQGGFATLNPRVPNAGKSAARRDGPDSRPDRT